jgi:hypothetical protein
MIRSFSVMAISVALTGCSMFGGSMKSDTKVRSAGITSFGLALSNNTTSVGLLDGLLANSDLAITGYKVPIRRISLVKDMSGSGYNGTCGDIYSCQGTEAECLVDLSKGIDVDSLLQGSGSGDFEYKDSEDVCNGIAVEFCPDDKMGPSNSFNTYITASGLLGSTTYYTNAASGLSATGPAEEASVTMGCQGITTTLPEPIDLKDGGTFDVVLYAEPTGVVNFSSNKTLINSNCVGEDNLALCTNILSIFATNDTATPKVERYRLDVTTESNQSTPHGDMLLSLLVNTSDVPFGATVQAMYQNIAVFRNMHNPSYSFTDISVNDDKSINLDGWDGTAWLANFKREEGASWSASSALEQTVSGTAKKL